MGGIRLYGLRRPVSFQLQVLVKKKPVHCKWRRIKEKQLSGITSYYRFSALKDKKNP
jgi:hypothetical protein